VIARAQKREEISPSELMINITTDKHTTKKCSWLKTVVTLSETNQHFCTTYAIVNLYPKIWKKSKRMENYRRGDKIWKSIFHLGLFCTQDLLNWNKIHVFTDVNVFLYLEVIDLCVEWLSSSEMELFAWLFCFFQWGDLLRENSWLRKWQHMLICQFGSCWKS
jgi:hypothetical protein